MPLTLAFDVYGTLIDTRGLIGELVKLVGDKAEAFSRTWRDKQLEYSFRRGLMQNYADFTVCTRNALDYTCACHKKPLSTAQKNELLEGYRSLPAFQDATDGLTRLQAENHRLFAFSNGSTDVVENLLGQAGIRDHFQGVVSTEDLKSFKPNPGVYAYFLRKAEAFASNSWLISGNPFDVIGAISAGMRGAWIKRSQEEIFDPWGIAPTITASSIKNLAEQLSA